MRAGIVARDQNQRASEPAGAQLGKAFAHEKSSNSFSVICGRHCQVINEATAAVVPAEHCGDNCPVLFRDAT